MKLRSDLLMHLYIHNISPPFFDGGQLLVPNFENEESEKNECLGGFKEFLPWTFAWGKRGSGGNMFLVKKRLLRIKYAFEGSISNVDLGLF